jgi:uncharacterized protein YacL
MFDTAKLIVLGLIITSFGANVLLYKWHTEDQLQLKMLENAKTLEPLSNESSELLSIKYQALKNKFLTNDYNLRSKAPDQPPVDVKMVCDADNGVNCVYFKGSNIKYYGKSDESS